MLDVNDIPFDEFELRNRPFPPVEAYADEVLKASLPPMLGEIEWFDDLNPALDSSYVIKGLLDRGAMSVIYGPSNSGKTFFALDLAYHVAACVLWRDRRVVNGTVLYLAAEGGHGIANRVVALRQAYNASKVPLALRRAGLDLLRPEADVQRIIDLVNDLSPRGPVTMIVIDTLSRVLAGGDENGPADMTAFVKNIDSIRLATAAHMLIVHHTGKDAARGARGHSSLRAATDTEIEISVSEGGDRVATVQKQRDYPGGETFQFELESLEIGADPDGDPVRTCVVKHSEQTGAAPNRPKATPNERIALQAIDDALAEHGVRRTSSDFPQSCAVVASEDWRKHFYRHSDDATPEAKRQAFRRASQALRKKGYVGFYDDFYWRCFDDEQA